MSLLQAQNLYRFFHVDDQETLALRGISLQLEAGEVIAVMGPSGSGKSTLLACLAGLDEPDGGVVEILGRRLSRRSEVERAAMRARSIGVLLQAGNLIDHLTVEENVRMPMYLSRRVDRTRVDTLLQRVGLTHRRHAYPSQLSGGEVARAGLAVALAANPPILLADEPTGEVDAETEQQIVTLILAHRDAGGAALIATHSEALAATADRVVRLTDGRIDEN